MVKLKSKHKIFLKKIIHLNFLTKFIFRIAFQRSYKTFGLIKNITRLKATVWVDWHKELFEKWAIKKNQNIFNEALEFYSFFSIEKKKL